jgi:tRNA pseudouridine38-40 synthase
MRTILLQIEYDGTEYAGWQVQPNGVTVQEVVESALAQLLGKDVRIHSSGRTDAGVHARGMMAHFHTEATLPLKAFRDGVNRFLPRDVVIRSAEEQHKDFHARYSAKGKWYRYTIYNGNVRSPLCSRSTWNLRGDLDLNRLRRAASCLVGEHDFSAFRSSSCTAKTTVREIYSVKIGEEGQFIYIDVRGSGFLKNMVRMMVGTLVEIGQGRRPVEDIEKLLAEEPGMTTGATAPAKGLCLEEVWY